LETLLLLLLLLLQGTIEELWLEATSATCSCPRLLLSTKGIRLDLLLLLLMLLLHHALELLLLHHALLGRIEFIHDIEGGVFGCVRIRVIRLI
jgi:hypothetical protein